MAEAPKDASHPYHHDIYDRNAFNLNLEREREKRERERGENHNLRIRRMFCHLCHFRSHRVYRNISQQICSKNYLRNEKAQKSVEKTFFLKLAVTLKKKYIDILKYQTTRKDETHLLAPMPLM
jgi:hypothetical protein